eukprot:5434461-Pleurochrysis_carterae.AAC.3
MGRAWCTGRGRGEAEVGRPNTGISVVVKVGMSEVMVTGGIHRELKDRKRWLNGSAYTSNSVRVEKSG